jgi:hypothetical protein
MAKYSRKAGEEVRTEMRHMKSGKHRVRSRKQAIAIGLSKARRKGAKVPSRTRSSGGRRSTTRGRSATTRRSSTSRKKTSARSKR